MIFMGNSPEAPRRLRAIAHKNHLTYFLDSPVTGDGTVCLEAIATREIRTEIKMIRIGDFSKLSQVTIKALRYYDEMGLLKPISVDQFPGYRYYAVDQLSSLNRILPLNDLGLSLYQPA